MLFMLYMQRGVFCFYFFVVVFVKSITGIAYKKELLLKYANGKVALQQVAQSQGSFEPWKYL